MDARSSWGAQPNCRGLRKPQYTSFFTEITGVGRRGFLFDGSAFIDLGTLPGGNYSEAFAVNEHGQATGTWGHNVMGDPAQEAFVWDDGVMTPLGSLLGAPQSDGFDINDSGWVTGWKGEGLSTARAFVWDGVRVRDLELPAGALSSVGRSINSSGSVAGHVKFREAGGGEVVINAALWVDGEFIDLGRLDGLFCRANGINEAGVVTGTCNGGMPNRAFLWQDGVMYDLNDLIVGKHVPVDGAWAINETGQVTGGDFHSRAVVVSPIDPPLTDLTGDCTTDAADLLVLLSLWGESGTPGDFDGDGLVGLGDLLTLLGEWT